MKNTKKLYETIMASVAKQVKKAINEDRFGYEENNYHEDEIDIQGDTEEWESVVKEYLWNHVDNSADTTETLGLFATLVYLDQLDIEEIKDVAESIMDQIDDDEAYENPPVDEIFFEPVAECLKDNASDWCADVINEWKLN